MAYNTPKNAIQRGEGEGEEMNEAEDGIVQKKKRSRKKIIPSKEKATEIMIGNGLNIQGLQQPVEDKKNDLIYKEVRSLFSPEEQDHLHMIFLAKLAEKEGIGRKQRKLDPNWFKQIDYTKMPNNLAKVALAESLAEYLSRKGNGGNTKFKAFLDNKKNANFVKAFNFAKDKLEKKKESVAKRKESMKGTLAKNIEPEIVNKFMAENGMNTPEQKEEFMEYFRQMNKDYPKDMPTVLKLLKTSEVYREEKNQNISTSKSTENVTSADEDYNDCLYHKVINRFRPYEEHQIHEILERMLVDAGIVGQDRIWHYKLLPPQILRTGLAYSLVEYLHNRGKSNVEDFWDANTDIKRLNGKMAMQELVDKEKEEKDKSFIDNYMTENRVIGHVQQEKFLRIYENLNWREKMAADMPLIVKLHDVYGIYLKKEEDLAIKEFMAKNQLKAEVQQDKFKETYQELMKENKFQNLKMEGRLYRTLETYKRRYPFHVLRYQIPNKLFFHF